MQRWGSGRPLSQVDREGGWGPESIHLETATMGIRDRPLEREERTGMSTERQWGALELVGVTLKEDPATDVGGGRAATGRKPKYTASGSADVCEGSDEQ